MSRSRKQKKSFACGHRGFGQWCHFCAARQQAQQASKLHRNRRRQQQQQQWRATFRDDPIDLTHLPKHVVKVARHKLRSLAAGNSYHTLNGKRLKGNRSLLSIPVTHNYRLLCHITSQQITPLQVLSHEDYNAIARNTRR